MFEVVGILFGVFLSLIILGGIAVVIVLLYKLLSNHDKWAEWADKIAEM